MVKASFPFQTLFQTTVSRQVKIDHCLNGCNLIAQLAVDCCETSRLFVAPVLVVCCLATKRKVFKQREVDGSG